MITHIYIWDDDFFHWVCQITGWSIHGGSPGGIGGVHGSGAFGRTGSSGGTGIHSEQIFFPDGIMLPEVRVTGRRGRMIVSSRDMARAAQAMHSHMDRIMGSSFGGGRRISSSTSFISTLSSTTVVTAAGETVNEIGKFAPGARTIAGIGLAFSVAGGTIGTAYAYPSIKLAINEPTPGNIGKALVRGTAGLSGYAPYGKTTALSFGLTLFDFYLGEQFYNWLDISVPPAIDAHRQSHIYHFSNPYHRPFLRR